MDAFFHGYKVTEDSPVFIRTTGEPLLPYAVTHGFKGIVKKLGLDDVRFHDLRHTTASLMIAQGENPKYIQSQMRHASIKTTFDRYGHLFSETHKEAVARLDATLATNTK